MNPDRFEEFQNATDEEVLKESYKTPKLFELLVERHEEAFIRKAKRIVKSDEVAQGVVQDTFVKIYMYGKNFKPVEGAKFTSWGYKILINTCFLWYKKMKRDREFSTALDDEMEAVIADDNSDEKQILLDKDYLESLFAKLPETFARILRLYVVSGKNYAEIAQVEGVTEGAIKTRMHRAKKLLKDASEKINY